MKNRREEKITLDSFVGKNEIVKTIRIGIKAFHNSGKCLDHILFYGPAGVGKTSLSRAIANELNVNIKIVQGINIQNVSDLMGILSSLKEGDILFIDEIHTIKNDIGEILYPALENKVLDLIVGKNYHKRALRIPLPNFTLIAATTNLGSITKSLEDRFGYIFYLDTYTNEELTEIIIKNSQKLGIDLTDKEVHQIVESSRGVPRNAIKMVRRINDYKLAEEKVNVERIIKECGFIHRGLNQMDLKYLKAVSESSSISLNSLSFALNLDEKTIVNKIESHLFSSKLISRNNKGRQLTQKGEEILQEFNNSFSKKNK